MTLEFNPELHQYKADGLVIPSVTQVLKAVGLVNFDFVPADVLQAAADKGTKVHQTTELFDKGVLDEERLHPILQNYLNSWKKFRTELQFDPIEIESLKVHELYRYAGTLDRVGTINKNKKVLIDIKTGVKDKSHSVQTAAYKLLYDQKLSPKEKIKERFIVYLSEDGYKIELNEDQNDERVFLAALTLFNYTKKERSNGKAN